MLKEVVVVVVVAVIVAIALRPFKMCVDFGIKCVILFTFVRIGRAQMVIIGWNSKWEAIWWGLKF